MELRKKALAWTMSMVICGAGWAFGVGPQDLIDTQAGDESSARLDEEEGVAPEGGEGVPGEEEASEELEEEASEEEPPVVHPAVPHDPRGTEEWLEPAEDEVRRFGLGVGLGLVNAGPTTEAYYMASLRIRFGQRDRQAGGLGGYLEPEVGYWERRALGVTEKDILIGVNVGGVVQLRAVSYFVGAGVGLHFIDTDRLGDPDDATSIGVNVQFGVDVHLNPTISMFGVGRVDLVEEWDNETQAKIYLGLRVHF